MLFFIDITMPAFEVATGQDVKKNIGGIFGKGDGFLHVWYVSLGLEHMKKWGYYSRQCLERSSSKLIG